MRYIEVQGIGFPNKGAELMLAAVLQWQRQRYPDARVVMPSYLPFADRMRYGTWQKFWRNDPDAFQLGVWAELVPKKWLRTCGIVRDSNIDALLDVSGFAYGDSWGASNIRQHLSRYLPKWSRQGRPVVLLPQAFGPFEKEDTRREMRVVLEHADLVCARDPVSRDHLARVGGPMDRVEVFPDFTCLVSGVVPAEHQGLAGRACLIPNAKMVERGGVRREDYVRFFATLCRRFAAEGGAYLLLHEGDPDRAICEAVRAEVGGAVELVAPADPLVIKGLIGSARVVVTSRFHGLVSALSQGVPAVATSWSHKYRALAADYTTRPIVLDKCDEAAAGKMLELLGPAEIGPLREEIQASMRKQKELARKMWDRVETILERRT
jgi:polysaccharide pyruvyl transferase WcaK-like protein